MAGEWQQHNVSALIDGGSLLIGDGYRAKNEELASSGLPFARAGNINNGFQFEDADHFPEASLPRVGNKISQPGDVVFTSKGTVGRFAFVRQGTPRFVYSPQLCFWRSVDKSLVDPRFLYFWMYGREFFVQFKGVAGQTDMAEYVSLSDQRRMHITLPPLAEQRAIAHILGTLDDKIELNRRMSETLEAMARALFKSWFVDFDPVRAKAEGRLPAGRQATPAWPKQGEWCVYVLECDDGSLYIGHTEHLERRFEEHATGKGAEWTKRHRPKRVAYSEVQPTQAAAVEREKKLKSGSGREWLKLEIARRDSESGGLPKPLADLFPARLVDSELGEIPEGWEVGTLADVAALNPEVWSKQTRPTEIRYVDLSNTKWGRIDSVTVYQADDAPSRAQRVLRQGDTIVGTVRPGNGSYALICESGLTGSTGFAVLRPKSPTFKGYVYLAATRRDNIEALAHLADGGAYPAVRPEVVAATPCVLPSDSVLSTFSQTVGSLLQRIAANEQASRTLAALRDALLPKLISGELRVKDAEKFIGRVA